MLRAVLALVALLAVPSFVAAQPKPAGKAPSGSRALAAEAAATAYVEAKPAVTRDTSHDMAVTVQCIDTGRVDRVSSRRALATQGPVAAVAFEGSPRDGSPGAEPPAQPVFVGLSVRSGK